MDIDKLIVEHPVIQNMINCEEIFWLNGKVGTEAELPFSMEDIDDAERRLARFAPYIQKAFPETEATGGIIESPLVEINRMKKVFEEELEREIPGRMFLKCDSHLAVSGSVKARGGIYEVLKLAETIAFDHNMLTEQDDYSVLTEDRFKQVFSQYSVAVGSTGIWDFPSASSALS